MNKIEFSINHFFAPLEKQEELIKFKDYQKKFVKKLAKLNQKKFYKWSDCFVLHDYVYTDKPQKKLPLMVWGKVTPEWTKFLKGREGIKRKEKDVLVGHCRLVEQKDPKGPKYSLEFRISKGLGKPKIMIRKVNKFLMPGEAGFGLFQTNDKQLHEITDDVDDIIGQVVGEKSFMKAYKKFDKAYRNAVVLVSLQTPGIETKLLLAIEQVDLWSRRYEKLPQTSKTKHAEEYELIQGLKVKFEALLEKEVSRKEIMESLSTEDDNELKDELEDTVDELTVETEDISDNTDDYNADEELDDSTIELLAKEEAVEIGKGFGDLKLDMAQLELDVKDLKDRLGKTKIPSDQRQLKQEIQELAEKKASLLTERQAMTDTLFKYWKESKGWEDKSPRELLREYGNNWFVLKEELGYLDKNKDDKDVYAIKLAALEKLLQYRQRVVDQLLEETKTAVFNELKKMPTMVDFDKTEIVAFALGSTTPTSDYDVTFQIAKYPQYEHRCVAYFNRTFMERFGVNSGMLFDTNVYTAGFMPVTGAGGKQEYKDKFNPLGSGKSSALPPKEKAVLTTAKSEKHRIELALSLASIMQFTNAVPRGHKLLQMLRRETISAVHRQIAGIETEDAVWQGKTYKKGEVKKIISTLAREDMAAIFKLANDYATKTDKEIDQQIGVLKEKNPELSDEHSFAQAKDLKYTETLEKVGVLLEKLEESKKLIIAAKEAGETRPDLFEERKKLVLEFKEQQGLALMYANEAYFSGGAALHVVKGMQGGGAVKLSRQEKMQSLLMNIGYQLQHFNEQAEHHGLGRAILGTSKYGQRVANLTKRDSLEEKKVQSSLEGIRRGSMFERSISVEPSQGFNLNDFMQMQDRIVRNCKKDDIACPTPSDKDAAALDVLESYMNEAGEPKGEEQIHQEILETFLRSASRIFGPYYVEKYKENIKRIKEGETDISPLSFW